VASGTARLVGTDTQRIVDEAETLLCNAAEYERMAQAHNPYGDGHACRRIVDALKRAFTTQPQKLPRGPQLIRKPATEAEIIDLEAARATAQGSSTQHRLNG
jgi:UDP-N-acetylglucosamine 2-epimerase (hydrolysing)